jgi:hypothetical protein
MEARVVGTIGSYENPEPTMRKQDEERWHHQTRETGCLYTTSDTPGRSLKERRGGTVGLG